MKIEILNFTDNPDVTMTCYIQNPSESLTNMKMRPGILILPGGGYDFCSDRETEPVALSYLAQGYNAFVLVYSVKEHSVFPRPLLDAEEALKLIRNNSKQWHVYPDKIACIGFSAGGHLAASLGTSKVIRPDALILAYPMLRETKNDDWDYPTPKVDSDTPPTFIFHTNEDKTVPVDESLYFATELQKYKVPMELHIFQHGVHGLSLGKHIVSNDFKNMVEPDYQVWFELSIKWLDTTFKVFKSDK